MDARVGKLARVLVEHSLGLGAGDQLLIRAPALAAPLVRELHREALRAGAHPTARVSIDGLTQISLREGSDEQLSHVFQSDCDEVEHFDATVVVAAEENTRALANADPDRLRLLRKGQAPATARAIERIATGELRWCTTVYPTNAYAQDAGMSLAEYEEFVFRAGHLDADDPAAAWRAVHDSQQRIADFLAGCDEIRVVAPDTDLTYRVGGRTWINGSGTYNFPDGEVFTGPVEDSVTGTVRFTYPAVHQAREVDDVRLRFEAGRVVEAEAARGEEFLSSMLETDTGARYVGEVAFGLNYDIESFTRNTLFDEKIGGTTHIALGTSYPPTGGRNRSALHWDMVCDLHDGRVFADGECCYERGEFIV